MGRRWLASGVAGLLCAGLLGGCGPIGAADGPVPPPSEAEARAYFAEIVDLALRGDFDGLCAVGDGNCRSMLEDAGVDAVPKAAPLIVGSRVIEPVQHAQTYSSGGLVLQVCGIDGRGDPYFDEVLVFRDGAALRSTGTVFWSKTRIVEGSTAGGPQAEPPAAGPG